MNCSPTTEQLIEWQKTNKFPSNTTVTQSATKSKSWRALYSQDLRQYDGRLVGADGGFQLTVTKSTEESVWGLQITRDGAVKTADNAAYVIEFEANSNNAFMLKTAIQTPEAAPTYLYPDQSWDLPGDDAWHQYTDEFAGNSSLNRFCCTLRLVTPLPVRFLRYVISSFVKSKRSNSTKMSRFASSTRPT